MKEKEYRVVYKRGTVWGKNIEEALEVIKGQLEVLKCQPLIALFDVREKQLINKDGNSLRDMVKDVIRDEEGYAPDEETEFVCGLADAIFDAMGIKPDDQDSIGTNVYVNMPEKDRETLLEVGHILQEYDDQDDQRTQEENNTMFWLMKAVDNGLSKTIEEYAEGIGNIYT